jgi:PAS domain S-box-containing protein
LLSHSNQALIHIADETSLLQEVCRISFEEGGYRMAVVAFAEQDGAKTWRTAAYGGAEGSPPRQARISWSEDSEYGRGPGGMAVRTGQPVIARDIFNDPAFAHWRDEAAQRGYGSVIALPLTSAGHTFGVLALYSSEADVFDADEVAILGELASNLAFGVGALRGRSERKRVEQAERRLHRELQAVSKCNQTLLRAEDEQTLLDDICRIVCDEAGYRMAWVGYREDDAAKTIRPVAWCGIEAELLEQAGTTWAETDPERPTGAAMRTGQSVCIQDFAIDQERDSWRARALQQGYRSCISLPLKDENKHTFGILSISSVDPNAFTAAEIRLLEGFSGDLAFGIRVLRNGIEHKRLEQQRQANLHFFTSMDRVNVALQQANDLEHLMGIVLDAVLSIFECDRAWLVYPCDLEALSWRALMERTRPEYPGAFAAGAEGPMHPEILRVYRAVLESNDPVAFGPGSAHPLPSPVSKQFSIQSMLATAIYPPTDKPYMFGLHHCSRPRDWTAEEQTLFQAIGRRLADRLSSLLAYRTLRQSEVRLRESLARVERLVDSNIIGVFFWNLDGRIDEANNGFLELLGYSRDELKSGELNWIALTPPEFREADAQRQELIRRSRTKGPFEKEYLRKDGTRVPVLVGFALLEGSEERGVGFVLDLTSRKQAEMEREARQVAEAANRAKSEFLANMSHEIRTPMNGIIGMSHLALDSGLNARQYHYVNNIHRSAQLLVGIINDVLDFSKIEAGKLQMDTAAFNLGDVMDNLANVVGLQAEQKGLELIFVEPPWLPTRLLGDPLRLGQVLINLTNNAVKFTERGEITVSIEVIEHTSLGVQLRFGVRDTGPGISAEQQQRLFQPFSQGDASTSRRYGGSGLGLAICHRLVGLMGGTIEVDSTAGHGSHFHFTAYFGLETEKSAMPISSALGTLTGAHVLVVDDNAAARGAIVSMCRAIGLDTEAAANGRDALDAVSRAALAKHAFDLVLLDWRMPDMDGAECAQQMQRSARLSPPQTVLMFTDFCREQALQHLAAQGVAVSGVLTKPVTPSTLFDACAMALGITPRKNTRSARREKTLHDCEARLSGARILLVEDNAINQELAVELLRGAGIEVTVAGDGRQALDLLERQRFDGVLMDCQMPVLDGYAATRALRQEPRFKDLPVIAMTANAMAGDREKALAAGMNDHIAKPISVDELFAKLALWVRRTDGDERAPLAAPVDSLARLDGIDVDAGRAATAGNDQLYRRILRMFADDQQDFAIRFRAAHKSHDVSSARRMAHDLTSVAGMIGAREVLLAAAALEKACGNNADDRAIGELLEAVDRALSPVIVGLQALGELRRLSP